MTGFIYKYENRINHKVYIGQTTDLIGRKSGHKYRAAFEVNKFYNAVRKYGWDNFDYDVIAQVEASTEKEITALLDELEEKFISEYDSFNNGYNSTTGGHSCRGKLLPESFREYCKNRQYSDETRKKMSAAAQNRVVSEETKEKHRQNAYKRNFSKYRTIYEDKRINNLKKSLCKTVVQIDADGNIVNEFSSLKEATLYVIATLAPDKTFNGVEHGLNRHCLGKIKKRLYYGFEWKFKANV